MYFRKMLVQVDLDDDLFGGMLCMALSAVVSFDRFYQLVLPWSIGMAHSQTMADLTGQAPVLTFHECHGYVIMTHGTGLLPGIMGHPVRIIFQ